MRRVRGAADENGPSRREHGAGEERARGWADGARDEITVSTTVRLKRAHETEPQSGADHTARRVYGEGFHWPRFRAPDNASCLRAGRRDEARRRESEQQTSAKQIHRGMRSVG